MLVSFVLSFFPRDVLDEILNLIGSVSEGFPSYSFKQLMLYMGSRLFTYYFRRRRFLKIYIMYVILTPLASDLWRIPRNLDSGGPIISEKITENGDKTLATQGSLPIIQALL